MQPLSRNLRPDLLTISDEHVVSCTVPATRNASLQISSNVPCPKLLQNPHICSLLARYRIPCACYAKQHLNVQTWSGTVSFSHFWLRNVLRANGMHFFNITTPTLRRFAHFDFEMCFAPQRHALFQHLNFQKCSDTTVLSTF